MAYDGITMAAVCQELNQQLDGARIEKIYQPRALDIALHLRTQKKTFLLLCSAESQLPRVHLSSVKPENPVVPPAFCMLLRKHLTGARFLTVTQNGLERVLTLTFRAFDDFGNETKKHLICEIMGKHSNIILTLPDDDGELMILGAAKTVTETMSRHRAVIANEPYCLPPSQDKLNLFAINEEDLAAKLLNQPEQQTDRMLMNAVMGLGVDVAHDLAWRVGGDDHTHPLEVVRPLTMELLQLADVVQSGKFKPCIVRNPGSKPVFSPVPLQQYPQNFITFYPTVNETLDTYYQEILDARQEGEIKRRLTQAVRTALTRVEKKEGLQTQELLEMEGADRYRVWGELLTASLYLLKPGMKIVSVPDYYSVTGNETTIPLNPALHPKQNAQRYFKKYRKLKDGEKILRHRRQETVTELNYLESLLTSLDHADLTTLMEIRDEMEQAGLIRGKQEKKKVAAEPLSSPLHFVSSEGIHIYVGRNNRQNDRLTLKDAASNDIWLHTKDIPGAHVIIKSPEPPEQTLFEAAKLAARFSKAAASSNVPVDYTHVRHVRKPRGAKPGMVIYDHQRTLYVTPTENFTP